MNSFLVPSLCCFNAFVNGLEIFSTTEHGEPVSYWRGVKVMSIFTFSLEAYHSLYTVNGIIWPPLKMIQIAIHIGTIGLVFAEAVEKGWKKEYAVTALSHAISSLRLFCEMPDKFSMAFQLLPTFNQAWYVLIAFEIATHLYFLDKCSD